MRLPEFILLILATIAAISAGLAMLASRYSIARVMFWFAALAFGSLGVMWSATSEGYSLTTQLIVSFIIGGIAATGLSWGLWEIRGKESAEKKTEVFDKASVDNDSRPRFDAANSSDITINNSVFSGQIPFAIVKAENGSTFKMSNSLLVGPGSATAFPAPNGEFSSASNGELRSKVIELNKALREFQSAFDEENSKIEKPRVPVSKDQIEEYSNRKDILNAKYTHEYDTRFAGIALSLGSEIVYRIGDITLLHNNTSNGGMVILQQRFVGVSPASSVADFLEAASARLPP